MATSLSAVINRFPEDKVCKGKMDCMRRCRIQGTVLTSGIAHNNTYSQHFKAKSINRNSISGWRPLKRSEYKQCAWQKHYSRIAGFVLQLQSTAVILNATAIW